MQQIEQDDIEFTKRVVKAYFFFKKNPNMLKKGSMAEALFRLLNENQAEIKKDELKG